jgi:hypothetical protein
VSGRRARDESGMVGGVEVLPFGFLLFVAGTLLVANAWGVVDAKLATAAGAREAARAYVESVGPGGAALEAARAAATEAVSGHGRDPARMTLDAVGPLEFRRCARATFRVTYRVPTIAVPLIGAFGSGIVETSARHSEVVDPYRDDVPFGDGRDEARCDA